MTWLSTRTVPVFVTAALWLHPVLAHAFAFNAPRGDTVFEDQTSGTPVIWEALPVTMSLNLGSPGRTLLNGTTSWDDNAEASLAVWNMVLQPVQDPFFTFNTTTHDPCDEEDGFNTVDFVPDICGDDFGDAIATTRLVFSQDANGRWFIVNADVLLDSTRAWDAYSGPLQPAGREALFDLRRVTLHEFGHVVGLGHPDAAGQTVDAVMDSHSVLESLTQDDIDGALFLYSHSSAANNGGGGGCTINPRAGFDPMLAGITGLILVFLGWRYARKRSS
jgi:hypothetical protein